MKKNLCIILFAAALAIASGCAFLVSAKTDTHAQAHSAPLARVSLGTYSTRNGFLAIVEKTDCDGLRPVSARIFGEGTAYVRYYTLTGAEYADGTPSPYDFTARK